MNIRQNHSVPETIEVTTKSGTRRIAKEIQDVAEGMETQFVNHLLTEMNKTVEKNEEESTAESFYQSMLNNERATAISKKGEIGLKDLIIDQLSPMRKNNSINTKMGLPNQNETKKQVNYERN